MSERAQIVQDDAERWAQRTLDSELGQPASEDGMARLMVGAAILINAIANVAAMDEQQVQQLVSQYRRRVIVQDRKVAANA